MNEGYLLYCEQIWLQWIANTLTIPNGFSDALPEPYLVFQNLKKNKVDSSKSPLTIITYNPGNVMGFQQRPCFLEGGVVDLANGYRAAAHALATYYQQNLEGAARGRIDAFIYLAGFLNCDDVLQLESCPFHSATFPMATKVRWIHSRCAAAYIGHLHACIQEINGPVIALSASGPIQHSLRDMNAWLRWQAALLGLRERNYRFVVINRHQRNGRATSAALIGTHNRHARVLFLMQGNNRLPGPSGLEILARHIAQE